MVIQWYSTLASSQIKADDCTYLPNRYMYEKQSSYSILRFNYFRSISLTCVASFYFWPNVYKSIFFSECKIRHHICSFTEQHIQASLSHPHSFILSRPFNYTRTLLFACRVSNLNFYLYSNYIVLNKLH